LLTNGSIVVKRLGCLLSASLVLSACGGSGGAERQAIDDVQRRVVQPGPANGRWLVFPEPGGHTDLYPFQVTNGPDGHVWFTVQEYSGGGEVGYVDDFGNITQFPIPVTAYPWDITSAPDGKIKYYALPDRAYEVAPGQAGNIWFTVGQVTTDSRAVVQDQTVVIGFMTPKGNYTLYTVPNATGEGIGLTQGHDGSMWVFVENGALPGDGGARDAHRGDDGIHAARRRPGCRQQSDHISAVGRALVYSEQREQ